MTTKSIQQLDKSFEAINDELKILKSPMYQCLWDLLTIKNKEIEELITNPALTNYEYKEVTKQHKYYLERDKEIFKRYKIGTNK